MSTLAILPQGGCHSCGSHVTLSDICIPHASITTLCPDHCRIRAQPCAQRRISQRAPHRHITFACLQWHGRAARTKRAPPQQCNCCTVATRDPMVTAAAAQAHARRQRQRRGSRAKRRSGNCAAYALLQPALRCLLMLAAAQRRAEARCECSMP